MNSDLYKCAQTFICHNNFNLASIDLHSTEGMDQTLANLIMLQNTFDKICNKINQKTNNQRSKINELQKRILICNQKIKILGSQKIALTFTSPSKYVRAYKFQPENNVSMFQSYLQRPNIKKFDMNCKYQMQHDIKKIGQKSKLSLDSLNELVSLLYFKFKPKRKSPFEGQNSIVKKKRQGLGSMPNDLKYIDSLLVFNSIANPYRRYQLIENNKVSNKGRQRIIPQEQIIPLDRAPEINTNIQSILPLDNNYKPKEKQIFQIKFDDNLDIQGIVQFGNDIQQPFFNPSKPGIVNKKYSVDPYEKNKSKNTQSTQPPQQQQQQQQQQTQSTTNQSAITTNSNNLPPPPPLNSSILPPPPLTNLQPPPLLDLPPPPPIGIPPPSIGLPPPPLLSGASTSSTSGVSALLSQINNPNPLARLKRTKTKEITGLDAIKPKNPQNDQNDNKQQGNTKPQAPRQLSHMELLQLQIRKRFKNIHPVAEVVQQDQNTVKGGRKRSEDQQEN